MNVKAPSLAALATTLALAASACGEQPTDTTPECAEPIYAGKATDEAWHALVDVRDRPLDTSGAVHVASPTEGQEYAVGSPPPTWEWSLPVTSLPRGLPATPRATSRSFTTWLGELILPSARAHLPPYTGEIYWVEVFAPGSTCPVAQVLTSELKWQPDTDTWAALGQRAGQSLTVQVTRAYLLQNRVTEGPYRLDPPRTIRWNAP
ncbi:MAG TPA: hypothetical protein VF664_07085 [Cystobacter sp.]